MKRQMERYEVVGLRRRLPEGGISIDTEVLCGCVEVLTDSLALLFSVPCVSLQIVGVLLPDTSGKITPLQQEDKDPRFCGVLFCEVSFISCSGLQHVLMCAGLCHIRCITRERMQKIAFVFAY